MLMMPTAFVGGAIVYPVLLFVMWWTMMMAMMLPSAAPAILTFGALSRKFAEKGAPAAPLAVFVAGYAAIWTGFAAAAVTLQLSVQRDDCAVDDDGGDQRRHGWWPARRGRPLPDVATQVCLPAQVPDAADVLCPQLAQGVISVHCAWDCRTGFTASAAAGC